MTALLESPIRTFRQPLRTTPSVLMPGYEPTESILESVSLQQFDQLDEIFESIGGYRLTYCKGIVHIMPKSFAHDSWNRILEVMIARIAEELRLRYCSGGQTTFRFPDLGVQFEPDGCFWFTTHQKMLGRKEFDPALDPVPELIIEVEYTRSALNRMPMFAEVGIQEVWRMSEAGLVVYRLQTDGNYSEVKESGCLGNLPISELSQLVLADPPLDSVERMDRLLAWIQSRQVARATPELPTV
jgi:Uma2 family endonuclease